MKKTMKKRTSSAGNPAVVLIVYYELITIIAVAGIDMMKNVEGIRNYTFSMITFQLLLCNSRDVEMLSPMSGIVGIINTFRILMYYIHNVDGDNELSSSVDRDIEVSSIRGID